MPGWALRSCAVLAVASAATALLSAQAPDGNAVLRAAGVDVPKGGAAAAFDLRMSGPSPVPPGAFPTLIVGMGPVGPRARVRNAYAFGVLAGRSGRMVPLGELAGAGVVLLQMMVAEERATRIAGTRVAGWVFATPLDGKPGPPRPNGLEQAVILTMNTPQQEEQAAAIEAVGLLGETAAVPTLMELFRAYRERNDHRQAGLVLEALTRIAAPSAVPLVQSLADDEWGNRSDATGLIVAFARERFLKDGSRAKLEAARDDRTLGPAARVYLAELGHAITP